MYVLNLLFTLFLGLLIPVYWYYYGPQNFLWLSDIGLFLTFFGLWFESSLFFSIALLIVLPVEIIWNIDFFARLFFNYRFLNITDYMFDTKNLMLLKFCSLFHIFVPIIWIWAFYTYGYSKNAFGYAIVFYMLIIGATYLFTPVQDNINWIFAPSLYNWGYWPTVCWALLYLVGAPFMIWLMHTLYKHI